VEPAAITLGFLFTCAAVKKYGDGANNRFATVVAIGLSFCYEMQLYETKFTSIVADQLLSMVRLFQSHDKRSLCNLLNLFTIL
jgi:hypothetical protein